MIISYSRGHEIIYQNNEWFYSDTMQSFDDSRSCKRCGKYPVNGHDACLGEIEGITSACCGHGVIEPFQLRYLEEW